MHDSDAFTPGYGNFTPIFSPTNYSTYTPVTTISIAEEEQPRFERIPCLDFLDKKRQEVLLQAGNEESYRGATILATHVRDKGYRVKPSEGLGDKAVLSALRMGMSSCMPPGMFPPPVGQLQLLLQDAKQESNRPADNSVTAAALFTVLKQCGDDIGVPFQLGVVCKGMEEDAYDVTIHRYPRQWETRTIWMFFDFTGDDTGIPKQWSVIIPRNLSSTTASWATVAAAPRPPVIPQVPRQQPLQQQPLQQHLQQPLQQQPTQQPSSTHLLHPGYSPSAIRPHHHSQLPLRQHSSMRGRSGRRSIGGVASGAFPIRGRHSSRSSRASSVSGTFLTCDKCSKSFETHAELM
jgi:hypothetical protein